MSTCRGCGSALDELTPEQISQAVEEVLEETRPTIKPLPGVCPLCGHSSAVPVSHRKSVQFGLLAAILVVVVALVIAYVMRGRTERQHVAQRAVEQLQGSAEVARYLGVPVTVGDGISGQVREDETGWQEARLTVPVRGSTAAGVLKLVGGRHRGEWKFTTLELLIPSAQKRIDVVTGRVVDYERDAYVDVHTEAARTAEGLPTTVPPARWNGEFSCVSSAAGSGGSPRLGSCAMPVPMATLRAGPLDRFELDLRSGKFVLRQTDLLVKDGAWPVPLTRTYASQFWIVRSPVNAFGRNSTHDFDIKPVGTRNPYTYLMLLLSDGDFLFLSRISRGGGYADAVYRHSETATSFYKSTTRWDGKGWETRLDNGATIHFPESYHSKNMAQGAPTQMVDAQGNVLQLIRDPQRNLKEIRTPGGHWIKLAHDARDRIVRAENDAGDWTEYRYGADDVLAEVRHSDGHARHYTYVGELLTWVRDETGRALIHNWYRDSRVVRQDYANGESYRIDYRLGENRLYAEEATVTLANGSMRSFSTAESVPQAVRDHKWPSLAESWWRWIVGLLLGQ